LPKKIIIKIISLYYRKLAGRLGGAKSIDFYQQPLKQNYHFCYINSIKNYIINTIDTLLQGKNTTMFANNELYVIHPENISCVTSEPHHKSKKHNVLEFIQTMYPKQKFLSLVFEPLVRLQLIDDDLYFTHPLPIHVADFASFLNNKFSKNVPNSNKFIKLCKYLNTLNLKFPKVGIKNPMAQKYLC